jgi:hypothetical protein
MRVPLSASDVKLALGRAKRLLDVQCDRTFRKGLKPEVGIAAVGFENMFPKLGLKQPNERQQVWVDKKGKRIKLLTKRRALESGTHSSHDASATTKDCAGDADVFVFASVEMPKSWKDSFPSDHELENPENYRLWLVGWMSREEFNQKARMVDAGRKESPTWSASADCKSIKHHDLHPLFRKDSAV